MHIKLEVNVAGIQMRNPIMIASGVFGFGEDYINIEGFSNDEIGAIVLKGTTLHPMEGNPPPRLVEVSKSCGIINSIGLQNPSIDVVLRDYVPKLRQYKTNIILNIGGTTEDEYEEIAKRIGDCPSVHGVEVNISCPNIKRGGAQFGADPITSFNIIQKVRKATPLPVIAKLSPNVTDIKPIAKACIEAGANAISLINTVMAMSIDIKSRRPRLGANFGGLSGPAIKPIAIFKVYQAYQVAKEFKIPIIGIGGIQDAEDIIEFMLAGAKAVQIGTSILYYEQTIKNLLADLEAKINELQVHDVNDLVGSVILNEIPESLSF